MPIPRVHISAKRFNVRPEFNRAFATREIKPGERVPVGKRKTKGGIHLPFSDRAEEYGHLPGQRMLLPVEKGRTYVGIDPKVGTFRNYGKEFRYTQNSDNASSRVYHNGRGLLGGEDIAVSHGDLLELRDKEGGPLVQMHADLKEEGPIVTFSGYKITPGEEIHVKAHDSNYFIDKHGVLHRGFKKFGEISHIVNVSPEEKSQLVQFKRPEEITGKEINEKFGVTDMFTPIIFLNPKDPEYNLGWEEWKKSIWELRHKVSPYFMPRTMLSAEFNELALGRLARITVPKGSTNDFVLIRKKGEDGFQRFYRIGATPPPKIGNIKLPDMPEAKLPDSSNVRLLGEK